jgi:hypothetical protein
MRYGIGRPPNYDELLFRFEGEVLAPQMRVAERAADKGTPQGAAQVIKGYSVPRRY